MVPILIADTPAVTEVFGLGTCLVGGVPLGQVLDMSIDIGNEEIENVQRASVSFIHHQFTELTVTVLLPHAKEGA